MPNAYAVEAQRDNKISGKEVDNLIAEANAIITIKMAPNPISIA
jgi:hypothetical protein